MRAYPTISCALLLASASPAQLVNGDFEYQGSGWSTTCPNGLSFSSDVPPGGGLYSARMPMLTPTESCYILNGIEPLLFQELPGIGNGDELLLEYWHKGVPVNPDDAQFMTHVIFFGWITDEGMNIFGSGQGGGSATAAWAYGTRSYTFNDLPLGETAAVFLGGHALGNSAGGDVYFDQVALTVDFSTGQRGQANEGPAFRPNPATDKLWVDLPDVPLSITAIDATGRSHALQHFQHTSRTLEVNVLDLPPGVTFLRITTPSGIRNLRFLKN